MSSLTDSEVGKGSRHRRTADRSTGFPTNCHDGSRLTREFAVPNIHRMPIDAQMASGFTPDEHTAKVCFQILKAALTNLAGER